MTATMVSFAFNTMIGQVTPIAMTAVGWKFYVLFVVSLYLFVELENTLTYFADLQLHKRPLLLGCPSRDCQAPA